MPEHYVADLAELQDSGRKIVRLGSTDIALLLFEGDVLAFENVCMHMGGPVGEGTLINAITAEFDADGNYVGDRFVEDEMHLVCPWHGWEYVLPGGQCAAAPERRLRSFPVSVRDGRVLVDMEAIEADSAISNR